MKTFAMLALAAALPFAAQSAAAADWYPSAYGAKDEIGAANLLTPEVVKQAVGLVRTGKTYPLAVPVDKNLPAFRHRSFRLYNIQPGEQAGQSLGPNRFTFNDELVNAWTGVGTSSTASATSVSTTATTTATRPPTSSPSKA
ncbi:cyclase family protein [Pseudomonas aeruginosa]|nr:cyclase family protein [Pseudomonas aeruginosa]